MTIYLDIVLFENLFLNSIIIFATSIIGSEKTRFIKIFISSLFGGIFSIINYIVELNWQLEFIIKILISIIMIKIAFPKCKIKKFFKMLMFFYLVSFTLGGIAFMLLFFINPENIVIKGKSLVGYYPIEITLIASIISLFVFFIISKIIRNNLNKKCILCDLEIYYDGNFKKIKAMLDTGNLLKDPINKREVVIVEKDSLKNIISEDILNNLDDILEGNLIDNEKVYSYKLNLIPFSSLGKENGLLIGFKPDYVKIYFEEEIVSNNVLIGIYDGKLSKNNLYTSLIGLDILNKEGVKNEFV